MNTKYRTLVENEEENILANSVIEANTRSKEPDFTEYEIQEGLIQTKLLIQCLHDFGYQITKIGE